MPITFKRGQIKYRTPNGDYENLAAVGRDGTNAHVYIRYAAEQPTRDADMKTTPDEWIGINSGREGVEPAHYTDYQWYKIKGDVGIGLPTGGSTNQILGKVSGTNYDVGWINQQDISGKINATEKGAANGVAELDSNGKVPTSQLPSYVDDVVNGYLYSGAFYEDSQHQHQITGEDDKIYIDLSTEKTYRWSGSVFAEISKSLALGTTSSTAYRGDRGQTAYSHATDASRTTTAKASGLYKVAVTNEGHVASADPVAKSDLTALGVADATDTVLQTTLSRGRKANTTVGERSFAFGYNVEATASGSNAFGNVTKATGVNSLAEGNNTTASGAAAHSEGINTAASGTAAHADCGWTTASGDFAKASGLNTEASGEYSSADGYHTVANHQSQHVFGEYNVPDPSQATEDERGTYIEIVGNGTNGHSSNARSLDFDGNEYIKGTLRIGCNADSSGGTEVATVDDIPDVSGFYSKPNTGIPKTDLASGVQTSLGKADTAYQKPSGGIPASDLASGVIPDVSGFYTKPQTGIPASDLAAGVIPTVHNVPAGGSANQVLAKASGTDYDLTWVSQSGGLPAVTSADNGKVLRVVSGAWAAAELQSATGVSF